MGSFQVFFIYFIAFLFARRDSCLSVKMVDSEYRVSIEIFEGPLDLLLYLAKKQEVDIYEISIDQISKDYLDYIETFKLLNIEIASEFVLMAANLMYIKSRALLPKAEQTPEDEEDEDDPRWELIRQLVEYKKFKDAAGFLRNQEDENENLFLSSPEALKVDKADDEKTPVLDVGIFDLIQAFQKVLERFENENQSFEIYDDRFTVSDKIEYLMSSFKPNDKRSFSALFETATSRSEVIVTFLALLELIKLNEFLVDQDNLLGPITLCRRVASSTENI